MKTAIKIFCQGALNHLLTNAELRFHAVLEEFSGPLEHHEHSTKAALV